LSEVRAVDGLETALEQWRVQGREQGLSRWLKREIDVDGGPGRLTIEEWLECARKLGRHLGGRPAWSETVATRVRALRNAAGCWEVADGLPSASKARQGWSSTKCLMAALADGSSRLTMEQRDLDRPCEVKLFFQDEQLAGPDWLIDGLPAPTRLDRKVWRQDKKVELIEWRVHHGLVRATSLLVLCRGLRMALASVLVEGQSVGMGSPWLLTLGRPAGVSRFHGETRALAFQRVTRSPVLLTVPLALPARNYPTERGGCEPHDRFILLKQPRAGRRTWLPLLLSWDRARLARTLHWRSLTVTENGKIVPPELASAVRVSFGRGETYLIYHSHGRSGLRAALGHCTAKRFLIGRFQSDGSIDPIVELD